MSLVYNVQKWHQTKMGFLVFALVELGLAYVLASWAIDKGNLLDYLCTFILLLGALQNGVRLLRSLILKRAHRG
jgi:hypothetical protein